MNTKSLILVAALVCAAGPAAGERLTGAEIMKLPLAQRSEKLGVPADVRYRLLGDARQDSPVDIEFFVLLGAEGQNLRIEYPADNAVQLGRGTSTYTMRRFEKSEVFMRKVTVTPKVAGETGLHFIVSMDVGAGRYFTVFTIPIDAEIR
jgi:hypothetical protein